MAAFRSTKNTGKRVSHSRKGYQTRSQVRKKSALLWKHETGWSKVFSGLHRSFVEHFSCAISMV